MYNQLKYAVRQNWNQRGIALGATLLLNVAFGIMGTARLYGMGGKITATTLSSLALCALFGVCIVADIQAIRSLFSAPAGYNVFLTPVPRWKILLGQILPIVVMDLVSLTIGIVGVVYQSFLLSGIGATGEDLWMIDNGSNSEIGWFLAILVLGYFLLVTALFFGAALSHSLFYRLKGRGFLAVLAVCAALYLLSWVDLVLTPFGSITRFHLFFSLNLTMGFNPGMIGYIVLLILKSAALFYATAYMMERKINI